MGQPKGITIGGIGGEHCPQGCRRREETQVIQTLAVPVHAHLSSGLRHLERRQKVKEEVDGTQEESKRKKRRRDRVTNLFEQILISQFFRSVCIIYSTNGVFCGVNENALVFFQSIQSSLLILTPILVSRQAQSLKSHTSCPIQISSLFCRNLILSLVPTWRVAFCGDIYTIDRHPVQ